MGILGIIMSQTKLIAKKNNIHNFLHKRPIRSKDIHQTGATYDFTISDDLLFAL